MEAIREGKLRMGAAQEEHMTPGMVLGKACIRGEADLVEWALDEGAGPDEAVPMMAVGLREPPYTPMFLAAHEDNVGALRAMLARGAAPDAPDPRGRTPLHGACYANRPRAAALLLERGASPTHACAGGHTPLIIALRHRDEPSELVRLLLARGADPNAVDPGRSGVPALTGALIRGHSAAFRALLEAGADADLPDARGAAPLFCAAFLGNETAARALLGRGAAVDRRSSRSRTPLYAAALKGHAGVARLLLDRGAGVDSAAEEGGTPLYAACQGGHAKVARLLLDRGADANRADRQGSTPLHVAVFGGHAAAVRLLLQRGADDSRRQHETGDTPADLAAHLGRQDIAAVLARHAAARAE